VATGPRTKLGWATLQKRGREDGVDMPRNKVFKPTLRGCISLCVLCIATVSTVAQTETWHLDPPHSAAQFSVRHMGISTVRGTFTKVSGDVKYSPSDLSKSSIDVVIDAKSADTRVEMRDNDVRSDHFLDVAKYPTIAFKSKHVAAAGAGKLKVTGDLTIHGVTKEVVLDVDGPTPPMKDPMGNPHMGASASAKINRSDFGMTGMAAMVGDEVTITIDVELVQRSGPPPAPPSGQAPPPGSR
jgi:polyisoprenoid-binding protein YceI